MVVTAGVSSAPRAILRCARSAGGAHRPRTRAPRPPRHDQRRPSPCTSAAGCGAGVLNPAPSGDVSALYPPNYLSAEDGGRPMAAAAGSISSGGTATTSTATTSGCWRGRTGRGIGAVGSYLDLGCGSGERVTYAAERGCARAVGVDKFDFAKSAARAQVELVNAEILDFAPGERFQVVSLFHVLEHLEEPRRVLAHIRERVLEPGGHVDHPGAQLRIAGAALVRRPLVRPRRAPSSLAFQRAAIRLLQRPGLQRRRAVISATPRCTR